MGVAPRKTQGVKTEFKVPPDLPGEYIKCFSCGRCVGDCPASQHSTFNIRLIIQELVSDFEGLLKSANLWKCFQCDLCALLCPVGLNPAELIRDLRRMALSHNIGTDRVSTFLEFYSSVKNSGLIIPVNDRIIHLREKVGLSTSVPFIDPASPGLSLIKNLPLNLIKKTKGNTHKKLQEDD